MMSEGSWVILLAVVGITSIVSAVVVWKIPDWINNKNLDSLCQIQNEFPDEKRKYFVTGQYDRRKFFHYNLILIIIGLVLCVYSLTNFWPNTNQWSFIIGFGIGLFFLIFAQLLFVFNMVRINKKLLAVTENNMEIWSKTKGQWIKRTIEWSSVRKVVLIFSNYQGFNLQQYKIEIQFDRGNKVLIADWTNIPLLYRDILNFAKHAKISKDDWNIIEKDSVK